MMEIALVTLSTLMLLNTAFADEFLTDDEIKALVTNKTWEVHNYK